MHVAYDVVHVSVQLIDEMTTDGFDGICKIEKMPILMEFSVGFRLCFGFSRPLFDNREQTMVDIERPFATMDDSASALTLLPPIP